jgi:hypothetical protein
VYEKMSFWEKFKEFDKMMDEPAIVITTGNSNNNEGMQRLQEENKKLKQQLQDRKVNAIEVHSKLLE